jgi:hypothetical protein
MRSQNDVVMKGTKEWNEKKEVSFWSLEQDRTPVLVSLLPAHPWICLFKEVRQCVVSCLTTYSFASAKPNKHETFARLLVSSLLSHCNVGRQR